MFRFDRKQEVFDFGKFKIGGQPGEYPTCCIGTMFYARHKIVSDPEHGVFDKNAAEKLWNQQVEMSEITGNTCMNQIVAETNEAMQKEIDWFVEISDYPFLIDSSAPEVRAFGVKYATEIGVADRAVHNSINASITDEELQALKESDLDAAIVLAFNAMEKGTKGKMDILTKAAGGAKKGMLEYAKDCGITRILIDTAAMPLGAGSGATYRACIAVKAMLGLPVGGGFHNAASAWDWMKKWKKTHKEAFAPVDIGSNLVAGIVGADFYLYGPIENAPMIFPAAAMVDIMKAESIQELGLEVLDPNHPIKKTL
ncbi:tetrahydromethanopterin S-methyltransferase subunit H [Methanothrix sp.]|jgi:tetrahydromethanopterin S-methyltransferase subunit H|uniref:tetrahydromethanopterin S-methyltransferase subunit H n=1 Tax=Methanothrix sp. TaxID=90426 RepID=UPI00247B58FC|nr:tetrahydromethanopterin S-methyltransferase subunit H [Methanothrix sp.]MDH7596621.1 tetrahydromethanopterin S-methyltransferase subunit H [Methanothrix sp.]HOK58615.1 tetrahydromethanopterin S-methyltransferase subunit H [Methanothrix sp.]HOL43752.1 tetrahydromethanopterin S-methyltransferase subunit H [Methanothrix sp.]HPO88837.1 tetrahydromethanopterin S-methyltransferase subunit H [Methanothrix sp.]